MDHLYTLFTGSVATLYQCVQKIRAMEMERYGLQTGHANCLHHLYRHPEGLTHKELSAKGEMDKATVTRCVSKLLERGLATAEESSDKKYNRRIILTESGMHVAKDINERINRAVSRGSADLSDSEREKFYAALLQICGNLQAYIKEMENNTGE